MKMIESCELKNAYRELLEKTITNLDCDDDGDFIVTLCQTQWIRVLLVRRPNHGRESLVNVELSLPECAFEMVDISASDRDVLGLLDGMITHLQYIKHLGNYGFTIDVIGYDCLWTASCFFLDMPEDELFELLLPP
jgi:hypothetical protein